MTDPITAPGGWCAPSAVVYDAVTTEPDTTHFPRVTVARGGFDYTPPTPAEVRALEAYEAMIRRHVGSVIEAQHAAINDACAEALVNGWDVHVQRHYSTRFIGIELAERSTPYSIPTIHEHPDDYRWWDLDDD